MSLAAPAHTLDLRPLQAAYDEGRRAHPRLDLPFGAYVSSAGVARPPRAAADYYLARACNAGVPGSWERLSARFRRRLRGFLRKRGASASDAECVLDEVWGALATPPPRGGAPTRIGTYDGRGSLHAWLATILWRQLTARWRTRPAGSDPSEEDEPACSAQADPALSVSHEETARLLGLALEEAWSELTTRELQAVALKYRHRLPQTEIARVMKVGPPRVTRMLQAATARLRAAIAARFDRQTDWHVGGGGWAGLSSTVERMLARAAAEVEVPGPERASDG